eukprot:488918-Rhodomonas_salina.1
MVRLVLGGGGKRVPLAVELVALLLALPLLLLQSMQHAPFHETNQRPPSFHELQHAIPRALTTAAKISSEDPPGKAARPQRALSAVPRGSPDTTIR